MAERTGDPLKQILSDKTKEAESTTSQVTLLQGTLKRSYREKRCLQDKMKTLQKTVSNLEEMQREIAPGVVSMLTEYTVTMEI